MVPAYQFCDQVVHAPTSDDPSGHDRMRFSLQLQDAPAQASQLAQARPDKPWLNGHPAIIYVPAPRDLQNEDLRRLVREVIQSPDGKRCFWLLEAPLLDPNLTIFPAHVAPVVTLDSPEMRTADYPRPKVPFQGRLVIRTTSVHSRFLAPHPNDWLIIDPKCALCIPMKNVCPVFVDGVDRGEEECRQIPEWVRI